MYIYVINSVYTANKIGQFRYSFPEESPPQRLPLENYLCGTRKRQWMTIGCLTTTIINKGMTIINKGMTIGCLTTTIINKGMTIGCLTTTIINKGMTIAA